MSYWNVEHLNVHVLRPFLDLIALELILSVTMAPSVPYHDKRLCKRNLIILGVVIVVKRLDLNPFGEVIHYDDTEYVLPWSEGHWTY